MESCMKIINLILVSCMLTCFLVGCSNAASSEKKFIKAFGITHTEQAKKIAAAFDNSDLGNIEKIERDTSSVENRFIIYTDDNKEYVLYLSQNYGLMALVDKQTKEEIYSAIE